MSDRDDELRAVVAALGIDYDDPTADVEIFMAGQHVRTVIIERGADDFQALLGEAIHPLRELHDALGIPRPLIEQITAEVLRAVAAPYLAAAELADQRAQMHREDPA